MKEMKRMRKMMKIMGMRMEKVVLRSQKEEWIFLILVHLLRIQEGLIMWMVKQALHLIQPSSASKAGVLFCVDLNCYVD